MSPSRTNRPPSRIAHALDEPALAAGAVNLLLFGDNGRIAGHNTDAAGLAASLSSAMAAETLRGRRAILVGAGGAARAAILALCELGAGEICILNRNPARAEALARDFAGKISAQLVPALWSDWEHLAPEAAILLNATSAGMAGNPPLDLPLQPLPQAAAVCDIVYNPLETPLLKAARAAGHPVIDGLGMLMHQAVPAFAAFYGVTPAVTPALRHDLEEALRRDR